MSEQIKLKAHTMLSQLRGSIFTTILYKSQHAVQYKLEKPEEMQEFIKSIANPEKWEYYGIMSDKDKAVMEVLEYLLDDNQTQICKYR